jgi:hypothetical protein
LRERHKIHTHRKIYIKRARENLFDCKFTKNLKEMNLKSGLTVAQNCSTWATQTNMTLKMTAAVLKKDITMKRSKKDFYIFSDEKKVKI